MVKDSLLDWISQPGSSESHTWWANGKHGSICDPENNCIYRFIELNEDGNYKYGYEDKRTKSPYIAYGIVAWWLKFRRQKTISELYESYYLMRLKQYHDQRMKQADSWNADIEDEFINGHHMKHENDLIKRSEALYEYLTPDEGDIVKGVVNNYLQFLQSKGNKTIQDMSSLTKNEIITLKHLADGQQHDEAPSALSEAQFYMALKSLKSRNMVYAAFCEGEEVASSQIKKSGQAALDDMKSAEKRILRRLVANEGLTQDQFDLLQYAKNTGKCDNIFNIPWDDYKEQIWKELYQNKLIQTDYEHNQKQILVLTRLGQQTVDRIEDELYTLLSDDRREEEQIQVEQQRRSTEEEEQKIKDSGFRISEDRITDVIKTVWSMHDVGMFVDSNGKKPTVKSVMDAFAEFLQAKQFEQYSSYMNKALKTTKNTYLDVFYKMEESAEKHYNEKKERELGK